jgi:Sel1 repeat
MPLKPAQKCSPPDSPQFAGPEEIAMHTRFKLVSFIVLTSVTSSVLSQEVKQVLPEVGDSCRYQVSDLLYHKDLGTTVLTVKEVTTEGRVVVERTVDAKNTDTKSGLVTYNNSGQLNDAGRRFTPYMPTRGAELLTPMAALPAVEFSYLRGDGEKSAAKLDGQISAREKRTVPAGTYDGVRVTWSGWNRFIGNDRNRTVNERSEFSYFYADNLWFPVESEEKNYTAKSGSALSSDIVMTLVFCKQTEETAATRSHRAAERGDADAQLSQGTMLVQGKATPQDYAQAAQWYRKAALQGKSLAQYNLGVMYQQGHGVDKNDAQAIEWFRKAAAQGDAPAQYNLGVMTKKGNGIRRDPAQAMEWFRKAALQGYAHAQAALGLMYEQGQGAPRDYAQAYQWYSLAALAGDQAALADGDRLKPHMNKRQLADGQRLVREWQEQRAGKTP